MYLKIAQISLSKFHYKGIHILLYHKCIIYTPTRSQYKVHELQFSLQSGYGLTNNRWMGQELPFDYVYGQFISQNKNTYLSKTTMKKFNIYL